MDGLLLNACLCARGRASKGKRHAAGYIGAILVLALDENGPHALTPCGFPGCAGASEGIKASPAFGRYQAHKVLNEIERFDRGMLGAEPVVAAGLRRTEKERS